MKERTRQRLLWRLEAGRHVVVDTTDLANELSHWAGVPVVVKRFFDRNDRRMKYWMKRKDPTL